MLMPLFAPGGAEVPGGSARPALHGGPGAGRLPGQHLAAVERAAEVGLGRTGGEGRAAMAHQLRAAQ